MDILNALTDRQVLYIYLWNKALIDRVDDNLKKGYFTQSMTTPLGLMVSNVPISEELQSQITSTPDYQLSKSLVEVLEPYADIIESNGLDYSDIREIFYPPEETKTDEKPSL